MMVFFVLLTLGFIFELGKNALTIESRQTSVKEGELSIPYAFNSRLPSFISTYRVFTSSRIDSKRIAFTVLLLLVIPTVLFGIYPAAMLDGVHYLVSTLYALDFSVIECHASGALEPYLHNLSKPAFYHACFSSLFWIILAAIAIINKTEMKSIYDRRYKLYLYFIFANLSVPMVINIAYALIMLYNLGCIFAHFTFCNPWSYAAEEQFADLYCMDYHPTVEGYSVSKVGYHVSLSSIDGSSTDGSSTDGEASNYGVSVAGSPGASSDGSYDPSPDTIQGEVKIFATSGHIQPSVQELYNDCEKDPKKIFEYSTGLIADVETERDELLAKIDSEQHQNKIDEDEAGLLKDEANIGAEKITKDIKETNDVAVDGIDDTSDTEEFIFNKKKP